jgi:Na+-driven multidrug efflux pump
MVIRFQPSWTVVREALKIGLPSGLHYLILSFSFAVVLKIVAMGYGAEPISAAGIGWRLMHLTVVPVIGFGTAISTLVGQNLGAARPQRAVRATNYGLLAGLTCVGVTGTTVAAFPEPIVGFFIESPQVIGLARDFLRIVLANNLLLSMIITLNCTFAGAGDNMPSMIGAIVRSSMMISIAWTFSQLSGFGLNAIWLSMPVASFANLLVLARFYRKGRWKTRMERRETEYQTGSSE